MTKMRLNCLIFMLFVRYIKGEDEAPDNVFNTAKLLVLTVASEETDGFLRFSRSVHVNGLEKKVLGLGKPWDGGDMSNSIGGGYKVNLLKAELQNHKDDANMIILFTDSYDVIITGNQKQILEKFVASKARILFGAEDFCWPNKSLTNSYPRVSFGYKFLNSGGFIGYATELYNLVNSRPLENKEDDQLFYTQLFLDEHLREELHIKLDTQAQIFQNLNGQTGDVSLKFLEDDTYLTNTVYHTTPLVVHGNGPSKVLLNSMGSYLAKSWTQGQGCLACQENALSYANVQDSEMPIIMVAIFVLKPTPFLEEMLERIAGLNYPTERMDLFLHSGVEFHNTFLKDWLKNQESRHYRSIKFISHGDNVKEWHARNHAVNRCLSQGCHSLLSVDSDVQINNPETLRLLLTYNRPILGAVVLRPGQAWSTFWGAINDDGFYARSNDYMEIINNNRRGIWNVPYISSLYLIQKEVLEDPAKHPNFIHKLLDADMSMPKNFRDQGQFMYVTNLHDYGHLVNPDFFSTNHLHNDMWQMSANRLNWEHKYISPLYWKARQIESPIDMPCPDVYWFPLFSDRFCEHLVQTMEHHGQWSGGKSQDPRLAGGYENVPTVDIHMNQVEYEAEWLWILKEYVKPMAEKFFIGYTSDARAIMNFVVRYRPDEQASLRPHHDSSTYTINVALNRPITDYEGGGARFLRYNCSVVETRMGWALLHPGRLTHFHEGLPTTNGTRYIMVSFIDP